MCLKHISRAAWGSTRHGVRRRRSRRIALEPKGFHTIVGRFRVYALVGISFHFGHGMNDVRVSTSSLFGLVFFLVLNPHLAEPSFISLNRSLGAKIWDHPKSCYIGSARISLERLRFSMASKSESTDHNVAGLRDLPFKVLGVAGGIGSGKSTACKLLEDLGCLAHIGE